MQEVEIDKDFLREFEEGFNPVNLKKSKIPVRILGYGEISCVFEILHDRYQNIAFKRIPNFKSTQQVERYINTYFEYINLLREAGLEIPESGADYVVTGDGRIVLFIMQRKLDPRLICNNAVKRMAAEEATQLFRVILENMDSVWKFNEESEDIKIGLDGQISNWALKDDKSKDVLYFDTSTPMIRKNGVEQLETEIFLRACPPGIRILLKKFFLQDILDRYYDFRKVVVDLIANLFKEEREDLISRSFQRRMSSLERAGGSRR